MQPQMQAPSFLVGRTNRGLGAQAAHGISGAQPPRISIAANKFTLVDGAGNQRPHTVNMINPQTQQLQTFLSPHIDLVVIGVNMNMSKVFYDTAYDPNAEDKPPTCWSDNGVGPSTAASVPQSNTCAACPNNQWGSATSNMTGKQVKACNDAKKIAVILPGDQIVYQLRIPPATLKALKKYAETIGGYSIAGPDGRSRGADLCDVVTRVSFESQGVLKFEPVGFIDENMAMQMDAVTQDKLDTILGTADKPISTLPVLQQPAQVPAVPQVTHQPRTGVYVQQTPQAQPQPYQQPSMIAQPQPMQAPPAQFTMAQPVAMAQPGQTPPPNGPIAPSAPKRGRGRPPAAPAAPQAQQPQVTVVQGPPAMMMAAPQQFAQPPAQMQAPQPMQQPPAQQWTPPAHANPPQATTFGMAPQGTVPAPDAATAAAVLEAMNFRPQQQ